MANNKPYEILVHTTAPLRKEDEALYRSLATSFLSFKPSTRIAVTGPNLTNADSRQNTMAEIETESQGPHESQTSLRAQAEGEVAQPETQVSEAKSHDSWTPDSQFVPAPSRTYLTRSRLASSSAVSQSELVGPASFDTLDEIDRSYLALLPAHLRAKSAQPAPAPTSAPGEPAHTGEISHVSDSPRQSASQPVQNTHSSFPSGSSASNSQKQGNKSVLPWSGQGAEPESFNARYQSTTSETSCSPASTRRSVKTRGNSISQRSQLSQVSFRTEPDEDANEDVTFDDAMSGCGQRSVAADSDAPLLDDEFPSISFLDAKRGLDGPAPKKLGFGLARRFLPKRIFDFHEDDVPSTADTPARNLRKRTASKSPSVSRSPVAKRKKTVQPEPITENGASRTKATLTTSSKTVQVQVTPEDSEKQAESSPPPLVRTQSNNISTRSPSPAPGTPKRNMRKRKASEQISPSKVTRRKTVVPPVPEVSFHEDVSRIVETPVVARYEPTLPKPKSGNAAKHLMSRNDRSKVLVPDTSPFPPPGNQQALQRLPTPAKHPAPTSTNTRFLPNGDPDVSRIPETQFAKPANPLNRSKRTVSNSPPTPTTSHPLLPPSSIAVPSTLATQDVPVIPPSSIVRSGPLLPQPPKPNGINTVPIFSKFEIHPPVPATSRGDGTATTTTHLTSFLRHLVTQVGYQRYNPITVTRHLQRDERGYWELTLPNGVNGWSSARREETWLYLQKSIGKGKAGWGVSVCRAGWNGKGEEEGWEGEEWRVYCWGEVVREVWLLVWLASNRAARGMGARWVDAGLEGVVVMGCERRVLDALLE